ncbi:FHA domain-containing protein [Pseudoruegeria sp. HB172150]|uniref:FHA domain-containing protein n=1 Tax=Pseudoruegeria sp. HB172150 TaxID=2721164 RepID=UPI001553774F|nr:FHA domain-containing protein [Pseudoruegeria sp. HB172150]
MSGPDKGQVFDLAFGIFTIGRGETQDIRIAGDDTVSRKNHAIMAYIDEVRRFAFFDGGKANPIWVNDKVVPELAFLESGDMIRVGETEMRFTEFS